jgi:hypothetical protein
MPRLVLVFLLLLALLVGCVAQEPGVLSREGMIEIPRPEIAVVILPSPRLP